MHWKTKSAAARILGVLPFGSDLHHFLQRHVTREWPRAHPVLDDLIVSAREILADVDSTDLSSARFLEIGAGRDLAVALALRMLGVGSVTTLDIDRLARIDLINHSARYMGQQLSVPVPHFASFEDLAAYGVEYGAPARITDLAGQQFDCFYSVDTLEHIPPASLAEVLMAGRSLLKGGGIAVHIIDYSDHYARGSSASRLNFLRYSDSEWAPHNSRLHYTNRLRHSQYLDLFAAAGFRLIRDHPFRLDPADISVDEFDAKFSAMSLDDLVTLRSRITARV